LYPFEESDVDLFVLRPEVLSSARLYTAAAERFRGRRIFFEGPGED
jgi:hypothetical protein